MVYKSIHFNGKMNFVYIYCCQVLKNVKLVVKEYVYMIKFLKQLKFMYIT